MTDNKQQPNADQDPVGRLVRLAERHDDIPQERAARVKEAAQLEWMQQIQRRRRSRRNRYGLMLAAAAAAVLIALWLPRIGVPAPRAATPGWQIEKIVGAAWLVDGDHREALFAEHQLRLGERIETSAGGFVSMRTANGQQFRLDERTAVQRLADGRLEILSGATYVDSNESVQTAAIVTPHGLIQELGTQYEVRIEVDRVQLRLREGAVRLTASDGTRHEISDGEEFVLLTDGQASRTAISPRDPRWSWTSRVATVPIVSGSSVDQFLRWYARENGLRLFYADTALLRFAEESVIEGEWSELTPEQALEAVLATSQLEAREAEGELVVKPLPSSAF